MLKHSLSSCRSKNVCSRVVHCSCRCNRRENPYESHSHWPIGSARKIDPLSFVVPQEVAKEVREPQQAHALHTAMSSGLLLEVQLADPAELNAVLPRNRSSPSFTDFPEPPLAHRCASRRLAAQRFLPLRLSMGLLPFSCRRGPLAPGFE
jgi:hypothetical protein